MFQHIAVFFSMGCPKRSQQVDYFNDFVHVTKLRLVSLSEPSPFPGSLDVTGGIMIYRRLLDNSQTPLGERFSRTLAVSVVSARLLAALTHLIA